MGKVKVRVPATSANLGPGFDTLGCALCMYNTFTFSEEGDGICVTGCDEIYANENNLAVQAYLMTIAKMGVERPAGLKVHIEADIPVSRGLGSSSTLLVAGSMAANYLHGSPLSKAEILALCSDIEGHPDNVAPAICGGVVASVLRDGSPVVVRYNVDSSVAFTALVPDFPTSTEEARAVLPNTVPRQDAVHTLGCLAVLLKGLETGDRAALAAALDDRLHQPYREHMIKGYSQVRKKALELGCDGFIISGSGSTCLCIGGNENFAEDMQEALLPFEGNWQVYPLKVDMEGATIILED